MSGARLPSYLEFLCVVCPNGCDLVVAVEDTSPPKVLDVTGHLCPRGVDYAVSEVERPLRSIASSVRVRGGEMPLASVRTDRPIPLEAVFGVMEEIRRCVAEAPVRIGDVLLENPAGTVCRILATRNVEHLEKGGCQRG
jgi:CxxC motif-containing protein